jgi:sugar transferase EpsL
VTIIPYRLQKRLFDILLASFLLVSLSPLLLIVIVTSIVFLGLPVHFTQERLGKDAKQFHVFKFRTMKSAYNSTGQLLPDHLRLTRYGNFLRVTSIDELPQIINILLGHMSFVGPRPLLASYQNSYSKRQTQRHDALPGLTGLAQIHGRNANSWRTKMALDCLYVSRQSFALDFYIILRTLPKLLAGSNIQAIGTSHVPPDHRPFY